MRKSACAEPTHATRSTGVSRSATACGSGRAALVQRVGVGSGVLGPPTRSSRVAGASKTSRTLSTKHTRQRCPVVVVSHRRRSCPCDRGISRNSVMKLCAFTPTSPYCWRTARPFSDSRYHFSSASDVIGRRGTLSAVGPNRRAAARCVFVRVGAGGCFVPAVWRPASGTCRDRGREHEKAHGGHPDRECPPGDRENPEPAHGTVSSGHSGVLRRAWDGASTAPDRTNDAHSDENCPSTCADHSSADARPFSRPESVAGFGRVASTGVPLRKDEAQPCTAAPRWHASCPEASVVATVTFP